MPAQQVLGLRAGAASTDGLHAAVGRLVSWICTRPSSGGSRRISTVPLSAPCHRRRRPACDAPRGARPAPRSGPAAAHGAGSARPASTRAPASSASVPGSAPELAAGQRRRRGRPRRRRPGRPPPRASADAAAGGVRSPPASVAGVRGAACRRAAAAAPADASSERHPARRSAGRGAGASARRGPSAGAAADGAAAVGAGALGGRGVGGGAAAAAAGPAARRRPAPPARRDGPAGDRGRRGRRAADGGSRTAAGAATASGRRRGGRPGRRRRLGRRAATAGGRPSPAAAAPSARARRRGSRRRRPPRLGAAARRRSRGLGGRGGRPAGSRLRARSCGAPGRRGSLRLHRRQSLTICLPPRPHSLGRQRQPRRTRRCDIPPIAARRRPLPAAAPAPADAAARQAAEAFEAAFLAEMLKYTGLNANAGELRRRRRRGGLREPAHRANTPACIAERGGIGLAEQVFEALEAKDEERMIAHILASARYARVLRLLDLERKLILNGPLAGLRALVDRREAAVAEILANESDLPEAFLVGAQGARRAQQPPDPREPRRGALGGGAGRGGARSPPRSSGPTRLRASRSRCRRRRSPATSAPEARGRRAVAAAAASRPRRGVARIWRRKEREIPASRRLMKRLLHQGASLELWAGESGRRQGQAAFGRGFAALDPAQLAGLPCRRGPGQWRRCGRGREGKQMAKSRQGPLGNYRPGHDRPGFCRGVARSRTGAWSRSAPATRAGRARGAFPGARVLGRLRGADRRSARSTRSTSRRRIRPRRVGDQGGRGRQARAVEKPIALTAWEAER